MRTLIDRRPSTRSRAILATAAALGAILFCGCDPFLSLMSDGEAGRIRDAIERSRAGDQSPVPDLYLATLPPPAETYLRAAGVSGRNRVRFAKLRQTGALKLATDSNWLRGNAEEYLVAGTPSRHWYGGFDAGFGMTAYAYEYYRDGSGRNSVQLFPSMDFQTSIGAEITVSAFITLVSDLALMPTELASPRARWIPRDDVSAIVEYSDTAKGIGTAALCVFGEDGLLVSMESEERFRTAGEGFEREHWTVIYADYVSRGGFLVPSELRYFWGTESNGFHYATLRVNEIVYDDFSMF